MKDWNEWKHSSVLVDWCTVCSLSHDILFFRCIIFQQTPLSQAQQGLQPWIGGDGGRDHERQPFKVQVSRSWPPCHGHQPFWTQDPPAHGQSPHHYRGTAARCCCCCCCYMLTFVFFIRDYRNIKNEAVEQQSGQQRVCSCALWLSFFFLKASEVGSSCQWSGDTSDRREGWNREWERARGQTHRGGGEWDHLTVSYSKYVTGHMDRSFRGDDHIW